MWEFSHRKGFPYLGTGPTGVPYFVIDGCGNFLIEGFPYLGTGPTGVPYFVLDG